MFPSVTIELEEIVESSSAMSALEYSWSGSPITSSDSDILSTFSVLKLVSDDASVPIILKVLITWICPAQLTKNGLAFHK